jgi:hypothetical protein
VLLILGYCNYKKQYAVHRYHDLYWLHILMKFRENPSVVSEVTGEEGNKHTKGLSGIVMLFSV